MIMMTKKEKVRHQLKSKWYYTFWGTATLAVVAGQVYVGSGYRMMARSINRIIDATVTILEPKPRGYYAPLIPPPTYRSYPDDMVVR